MQTFDPKKFDPYRALGLPRGATNAQVKKAHRALAKRYHPDTAEGDTELFLGVQEAYRVLSDPLLRRDWDARHAPGPVRATTPSSPGTRPRRRAATTRTEADETSAPPEPEQPPPGPGRPRSKRAYTWSASEVPWWEEGATRDRQRSERPTRPGRTRPAKAAAAEPVADFEVYNRSSGAAWSMAARAYFRRGDEDLPRRGSFRQQGTEVVTAGRARMAAEAEALHRPTPQPGPRPEPASRPEAGPRPEPAPRPQSRPAPPQQRGSPGEAGVLGRLRRKLGGSGR
jgi:curved DNA-binding protein CbpA